MKDQIEFQTISQNSQNKFIRPSTPKLNKYLKVFMWKIYNLILTWIQIRPKIEIFYYILLYKFKYKDHVYLF